MNRLSRKSKKILYALLGAVIVGGVLLIFFPIYQSPIKDPTLIKRMEYSGESTIVITPRFTEAAYSANGFYDYYSGHCGKECLKIPLNDGRPDRWGSYNKRLVEFLKFLGYPEIPDNELHLALLKDPSYLNQYNTIILLHNEYVTKEIYQAVQNHQNVIYMSPNALYAEVTYDGKVISLVRGHNYPDQSIKNGFGWQYDNSPEEYDLDCKIWHFRDMPNGKQLNCVSEMVFHEKPQILLKMKDLIQ